VRALTLSVRFAVPFANSFANRFDMIRSRLFV